MNTNPALHRKRTFALLIAYRWASLLPAFLFQFHPVDPGFDRMADLRILGSAVLAALLITLTHRPLNKQLLQHPFLILFDLSFVAVLLGLSGGGNSPYWLYSLSPLMAAAFFFRIRGAVIGSAIFTLIYFITSLAAGFAESTQLFSHMVSIWLLPIVFGYASTLLYRLNESNAELTARHAAVSSTHDQLKIVHDLNLILQSAPDVQSVQKRVLDAVTRELGYSHAAVGLVDPGSSKLTGWRKRARGRMSLLSFSGQEQPPGAGVISDSLAQRTIGRSVANAELSQNAPLNDWLALDRWVILPMKLREHPVGILLVSDDGEMESLSPERLTVLELVAGQAAVALGTTMMCIDRARQLAVSQERNRIAMDIHDTVVQSLFGIVLSLDASVQMLPEQAERVREELVEIKKTTGTLRTQVRNSIFDLWSGRLRIDQFKIDLQSHASQCSGNRDFRIDFDIEEQFNALPESARQNLYRISQEAIANAVRHSGSDGATLRVRFAADSYRLEIEDRGRGFQSAPEFEVLARSDHLGLLGIEDRVTSLGGELKIESRPGQGTKLRMEFPRTPEVEIEP